MARTQPKLLRQRNHHRPTDPMIMEHLQHWTGSPQSILKLVVPSPAEAINHCQACHHRPVENKQQYTSNTWNGFKTRPSTSKLNLCSHGTWIQAITTTSISNHHSVHRLLYQSTGSSPLCFYSMSCCYRLTPKNSMLPNLPQSV